MDPTITMPNVKIKASQDSSDEGAHITEPDEPFNNGGAHSASISSSSSASKDRRHHHQVVPGSGHLDSKQRRHYLILLTFSVVNALIGLLLILIWMTNYRAVTGFGLADKVQLANLHPVLMYTFMVSLNMYSILIYRTHYASDKQKLKWTHAILSGVNIVMSLLGVAAMYKSHLMGNQANFYTLHSWIGALTNGVYLTQFIFGFIAFLKPGLKQQQRAKLMPWHRLIGSMILVLAATAAITGISELVIFQDKDGVYQKFTAITFIANFAGIATLLMTATTIYLVTATKWLRPTTSGTPMTTTTATTTTTTSATMLQ